MKRLLKTLSVMLVLVMLVQIMPAEAITISERTQFRRMLNSISTVPEGLYAAASMTAEQFAGAATGETINEDGMPSPIVGEVLELRTEGTKHFRHEDGTYTAAVYADPVHFLDENDQWQEIDNTLRLEIDELGDAFFIPAASGLDIRIPQAFSGERMLTMSKDGYTIGLSLLNLNIPGDEQQLSDEEDAVFIIDDEAQLIIEETQPTEPESTVAETQTSEAATTTAETEVLVEATMPAYANAASEHMQRAGPAAALANVGESIGEIRPQAPEGASRTAAETRQEEILRANAEIMELGNLVSAVIFEGMFPGADLEYVVAVNRIKENIIVREAQDSYIYQFQLDLGGLIPVPQEDGSINLYKETNFEEPLFILEAPYMFDSAGEHSTDLAMTLYEGGILALAANPAWVNAPKRVFPVTIDPTFSAPVTSGIQSTYVYSSPGNPTNSLFNFAGNWGASGRCRTYIRLTTLPALPSGSVVTGAELGMVQQTARGFDSSLNMYLYAFECPANWSMPEFNFLGIQTGGITWANQPINNAINGAFNSGVMQLDRQQIRNGTDEVYRFDITKAMRNWYENGNNFGIMITTNNEGAITRSDIYKSNLAAFIQYNTNIGLEPYWSYETVDLGRSGSVFVNNYNGALTYVHSTLNMTGNRLPINIAHVYNTNRDFTNSTNMRFGSGFTLNMIERIIQVPPSDPLHHQDNGNFRFRLVDGDATVHYFREITGENDEAIIVHAFDSTLELAESADNGQHIVTITDGQGNKKRYERTMAPHSDDYYLTAIEDNNGNLQVISWAGGRITRVTDASGRFARFEYNGSSQLISIIDPAGRRITFSYSNTTTNANLTRISYPGGRTTGFEYNGNDISRITATDNTILNIHYRNLWYGAGRRVSSLEQRDRNNDHVDTLTFEFFTENESGKASGNTVVSNSHGKANAYTFNRFGSMTSVTNQDGQVQFSEFYTATGSVEERNRFNKIRNNSELKTIAHNLLLNHGFELGSAHWSIAPTASVTNAYSSRGKNSVRMSTNNAGSWDHVLQGFDAVPGKTYTLSADFFIPEPLQGAGGAVLGFAYTDPSKPGNWDHPLGRHIKSTNGWERHSFTFTIPQGASGPFLAVITQHDAAGTFYVDNVQLEQSGGGQYYNLLQDSNFFAATGFSSNTEVVPPSSFWSTNSTNPFEGVYQVFDEKDNFIRNELRLLGRPNFDNKATQAVYVNAMPGETLIFGGRAGAYAKDYCPMDEANKHSFAIWAEIYTSANDPNPTRIAVDFDTNIPMAHQMAATSYTLKDFCYKVVFTFVYRNQLNGSALAEAFLYVENFGDHYVYNDLGQAAVTYSDGGEFTAIDYDPGTNKVVKIEQRQDGVVTSGMEMTYQNGRVRYVDDVSGARIRYSYNNFGLVTERRITRGGISTTETMAYTTCGQYLLRHTDARGNTTHYTYDIDRGLLRTETDPMNHTTTYSYHRDTDELESISSGSNNTNFTTQHGLPRSIRRNNVTYTYDYDAQNRLTAARVGSRALAINQYNERNLLTKQTFANNAVYELEYDSRDRLKGEKWNGIQTTSYSYSENNRLTQMTDHTYTIPVTSQFGFTPDGRIESIIRSDGAHTKYAYNENGALSILAHVKNGEVIFDANYGTDEEGRPDSATIFTHDNTYIA